MTIDQGKGKRSNISRNYNHINLFTRNAKRAKKKNQQEKQKKNGKQIGEHGDDRNIR